MKRIVLYTSFLIVVIFGGCSESLDRIPQDVISEESYFTKAAEFELFANSFYFFLTKFPGDDYNADTYAAKTLNTVSNGTYQVVASDGVWTDTYKLIRGCNYLLSKFDSYNGDDLPEASKYMGEAKFFRAYGYFRLLQRFGGVPLILVVLDVNSPELYAPRATREAVVDQILTDLEESIEVLPLESEIPASKKGRITKGAAQAFLARVALFEGTWRKFRGNDGNALLTTAADAAQDVIESGEYELWNKPDLGRRSYEYLFTLDDIQQNPAFYTKKDQKEFILVNKHNYQYRTTANPPYGNPTRKLIDMFLCTDGLPIDKSPLFQGYSTLTSEYENRDLRMLVQVPNKQYFTNNGARGRDWSIPDSLLGDPATSGGYIWIGGMNTFLIGSNTGYWHQKFITENMMPPGMDYPVIRYAEVLVTYAEAVFERYGSISDEDLEISINVMRERADMPPLTNAFITDNDLDMRTEIRRERAVELFGEGERFNDLRRWYTAHIELKEPHLGLVYAGTEWATDPRTDGLTGPFDENGAMIIEPASARKFSEKNYLFPLPTKEIALNPNLEQNPEW